MSKNTNRIILPVVLFLVILGAYLVGEKMGGSAPAPASPDTAGNAQEQGGEDIPEDTGSQQSQGGGSEDQQPVVIPLAKTIEDVPFTSQSPFGNWADPLEQHGCEEASLIMARHWITGKELTKEEALQELLDMSKFEEDHYGKEIYDLSIADTLKLWREYYGYKKSFVRYDIKAEDIKREIAAGNLVITPMDGTKLGNPYYTQPGPERHELVITGYDDASGKFITNDPGTRFGKDYDYGYGVFMGAIREYETGFDVPISTVKKSMLVIEKE